ncbi:MAG: class I SAM-dependent methyltransferase [Patescibacteria group bacterium]
MATKFKKNDSEENHYVHSHAEPLTEDKIKKQKHDTVAMDPSLKVNLNKLAKDVSYKVDNDSAMNFEHKNFSHLLAMPISLLMTVWAFLKTALCAFLTYIRHEEISYQPQTANEQDCSEGKKIVKWFNFNAALRVWWCVPQEKKGETLRPRFTSLFFDRFSAPLKKIRHGAASWKALDIIYHHEFGRDKTFGSRLADFWIGMRNAQAVRNRHKLVQRELIKVICEIGKMQVNLLSVACGSAEAVIQVVKTVKEEKGIIVKVTLLDLDAKALTYAKGLAKEYGIENQFLTINENIKNLEKVITDSFDVIEMLGFLDYQVYGKAVSLVSRLRALLNKNGVFLTCNIMNNPEKYFLRWVISWPMIYRKPYEVAKIMLAAGFRKENIALIAEPHEIHMMAICKLNSNC